MANDNLIRFIFVYFQTPGVTIHCCPYCNHTTWHRGNLNKHIRQVHADHRPHTCAFCNKTFKRKAHLKRHAESQHPPDPIACENYLNEGQNWTENEPKQEPILENLTDEEDTCRNE